MAFRTIGKIKISARVTVLIQRCADWQEFRARIMLDGIAQENADFHTDCREDVYNTGQVMGDHIASNNPVIEQ